MMNMASDPALLAQWLHEYANTAMIPSYHQIGTALQWSPEYAYTVVRALRNTVPFYYDHSQCVNPWSLIDPETIVTRLFPQHYFSGEWALYTHGIYGQRLRVITIAHPAQAPDPEFTALNPGWSLLRIRSIAAAEGPEVIADPPGPLIPLATPGQALIDWAAYSQSLLPHDLQYFERFLIDCDPEAVVEALNTVRSPMLAPLVQTLRDHFPGSDARLPDHPWI
jgi:hypothetical protein